MFKFTKNKQLFSQLKLTGLLALLTMTLVACDVFPTTETALRDEVKVWWSQGYYPQESRKIEKLINEWQDKSGVKVNLKFFSESDLIRQTKSRMGSNQIADVIYGYGIDSAVAPRAAWEGQLANTSEIIKPIKGKFLPNVLESVKYHNDVDNKDSYYAVPIAQNSTYVHYWNYLLKQVGLNNKDIPKDWEKFWKFWKDVQSRFKENKEKGKNLTALGLPISTAASDTHFFIEQMLEAYNIKILDKNGDLNLENREKIIKQLANLFSKITNFYQDGYMPKDTIDWTNSSNNIEFLSRNILMTVNPTLSIPGSQRYNETIYQKEMATMEWPNKPNGKPMRYLTSVKQIIIPKQAPKREQAKDLVSYIMQANNLAQFNKGSQGRYYPVMSDILESSLWQEFSSNDPHISITSQYFERTRPSNITKNPAYVKVQEESVWAKALSRMIKKDMSSRETAEEAVKDLNQIFDEWE